MTHGLSAPFTAPALWAVTAYSLLVLPRDPHFDHKRLRDTAAMARYASGGLGLFAAAAIGVALVLRFSPETFFNFPKENPALSAW